MSTKNIPARTIVMCDRCGVECNASNRRRGGGLAIKEDALDFQGMAVANAGRSYDLCDSCLTVVAAAVDASLARTTESQA